MVADAAAILSNLEHKPAQHLKGASLQRLMELGADKCGLLQHLPDLHVDRTLLSHPGCAKLA